MAESFGIVDVADNRAKNRFGRTEELKPVAGKRRNINSSFRQAA